MSLALMVLALAACGGKRTEAEHQLIRWAEALNAHLATSFAEGNEYPHRLAQESAALITGASQEHLRLDVTDDGFTLRHEGGTTLSPVAWATVYYACRLHAAIADVSSR